MVTNAVVGRVATPALSEPVPRVVVPFLKVTVPVGLAPVTVAVNVTDAPEGIEFALEVRAVVVVVAPVTVRAMVVVAVRLPEVPVMVTVAVPAVAELLAVSDRTLDVVVLVGLKDAVTPLGSPEAAKLTLPVKPPAGVTVMVLVPAAPPGVIDRLLGAAERVKLAVSGRLNSQMPRP